MLAGGDGTSSGGSGDREVDENPSRVEEAKSKGLVMGEGQGRVRRDPGSLAVRPDQMDGGSGQQIRLALGHPREPSCSICRCGSGVQRRGSRGCWKVVSHLWHWSWGMDGTVV